MCMSPANYRCASRQTARIFVSGDVSERLTPAEHDVQQMQEKDDKPCFATSYVECSVGQVGRKQATQLTQTFAIVFEAAFGLCIWRQRIILGGWKENGRLGSTEEPEGWYAWNFP